MNEYKNVCWNPSDLIGSKQAYTILINEGCSFEELQDLDFGNLDTSSVYCELCGGKFAVFNGRNQFLDYFDTLDDAIAYKNENEPKNELFSIECEILN